MREYTAADDPDPCADLDTGSPDEYTCFSYRYPIRTDQYSRSADKHAYCPDGCPDEYTGSNNDTADQHTRTDLYRNTNLHPDSADKHSRTSHKYRCTHFRDTNEHPVASDGNSDSGNNRVYMRSPFERHHVRSRGPIPAADRSV